MVHKIEQDGDSENVFSEGLKGWMWLIGKLKKNKKEEPKQEQSQQPEQQTQ